MQLPKWTVLPVLIGFFTLLLTDSKFLMFIIGYDVGPDKEIDVTRLILNCFIVGILPAVITLNLVETIETTSQSFSYWKKQLSEEREQLLTVVMAVLISMLSIGIVNLGMTDKLQNKIAQGVISIPVSQVTVASLDNIGMTTEAISMKAAIAQKQYPDSSEQYGKLASKAGELNGTIKQLQRQVAGRKKLTSDEAYRQGELTKKAEVLAHEMEMIQLGIEKDLAVPVKEASPR